MILHDEGRLTVGASMRKKMYYARDFTRYLRRHKISLLDVSPVRPAYLRHWKTLLGSPQLAVGMIFLKCCEVAAAAAGLLLEALATRAR